MAVDWDRWHELLDIAAERGLSPLEKAEYYVFAAIANRLDAKEGRTADAALDKLVKEHKRVCASIRGLTAAVKARTDAA